MLEARLVMHAEHLDESALFPVDWTSPPADSPGHLIADEVSLFVPLAPEMPEEAAGNEALLVDPVSADLLGSVPALSSLPGAAVSVYLDFDGHYDPQWGSYGSITTPAFDQDGNLSAFSASETATMKRIWEYVAEDYAPFQVNVTTVEPASFANGQALRVVVGGDGAWMGGAYGGVSYVDSFTNSAANSVYVFPKNLANGNAKYTADASSHEAGHGFGLLHQSAYDANGTKTSEYSAGPGDGRAPLMGNSYSATRSLWWNGPSNRSATSYQDDMAVLARATNGFGLRADDHASTPANATPLSVVGGQVSGLGLIGTTGDMDYFSFNAGPGQVNLTVDVPAGIQNLDATVELSNAAGTVLASASPSTFGAAVSATVPGGTYYLRVGSNGRYGDVGTYSVRGAVPGAAVVALAAPTGVAAAAVSSSRIAVIWNDVAGETGYQVQRSQNGTNWSQVASLAANTIRWENSELTANTKYFYRVRATNAAGNSPYSAAVSATTLPAVTTTRPSAPSNLRAVAVAPTRLNLTWQDNSSNETGFRIERYNRTSGRWWLLAEVGANVTSYADSTVRAGQTYYYRVRAFNGIGVSSLSNTAKAVTPTALPSLARAEAVPSAAPTISNWVPRSSVRSVLDAAAVRWRMESEVSRVVTTPIERLAERADERSSLFTGQWSPSPLRGRQPFIDSDAADAALAADGWVERLRDRARANGGAVL